MEEYVEKVAFSMSVYACVVSRYIVAGKESCLLRNLMYLYILLELPLAKHWTRSDSYCNLACFIWSWIQPCQV